MPGGRNEEGVFSLAVDRISANVTAGAATGFPGEEKDARAFGDVRVTPEDGR